MSKKIPLMRDFFEIRDKREDRREVVRLRRGLIKSRNEKFVLLFTPRPCG